MTSSVEPPVNAPPTDATAVSAATATQAPVTVSLESIERVPVSRSVSAPPAELYSQAERKQPQSSVDPAATPSVTVTSPSLFAVTDPEAMFGFAFMAHTRSLFPSIQANAPRWKQQQIAPDTSASTGLASLDFAGAKAAETTSDAALSPWALYKPEDALLPTVSTQAVSPVPHVASARTSAKVASFFGVTAPSTVHSGRTEERSVRNVLSVYDESKEGPRRVISAPTVAPDHAPAANTSASSATVAFQAADSKHSGIIGSDGRGTASATKEPSDSARARVPRASSVSFSALISLLLHLRRLTIVCPCLSQIARSK